MTELEEGGMFDEETMPDWMKTMRGVGRFLSATLISNQVLFLSLMQTSFRSSLPPTYPQEHQIPPQGIQLPPHLQGPPVGLAPPGMPPMDGLHPSFALPPPGAAPPGMMGHPPGALLGPPGLGAPLILRPGFPGGLPGLPGNPGRKIRGAPRPGGPRRAPGG